MSKSHLVVLALSVVSAGLGAGCGGTVKIRPDLGEPEVPPDMAIVFSDDMESIDPGKVEDLARQRTDAACAMASAQATLVRKPVDIIFIIDNSCSMSDEIHGVELNINGNFTEIMKKSGLDYRVIMLTHYGAWNSLRICVGPPLGKQMNGCMPPDPQVVNNPPKFFHYNWDIQSWDSFKKAIMQYNLPDIDGNPPPAGNCGNKPCAGWNQYLRKTAVKIFIEVTDDRSDMMSGQIDTALLALDPLQFGTAKKRNYILHSITGVAANVPPTKPWGPKDPIQAGKCGNGAVTNGQEYQELSILTGGLRFPICEWANFSAVFQEVAKGILEGTKVACEIDMPQPPLGQEIDEETLTVEYTPSTIGAEAENFTQVYGLNDCDSASFYIQGNLIVLCPDTCTRVQRDGQAKLRVIYDCKEPLM